MPRVEMGCCDANGRDGEQCELVGGKIDVHIPCAEGLPRRKVNHVAMAAERLASEASAPEAIGRCRSVATESMPWL